MDSQSQKDLGVSIGSSKTDPARQHGKQDPINKSNFTCNYCGKITKGGVYRFKQHLVGGFAAVVMCRKCPEHVREEITNYMLKKSDSKGVSEMGSTNDISIDIEDDDGINQIVKRSKSCVTKFASAIKGPMDMFLSSNAQDMVNARKDGKLQTINEVCKNELRKKACKDIARWFYDAAIPFNAATYESFEVMIESIGQFGRGMKPPSTYELRVPLLKEEVDDTLVMVEEHKKEWAKKGCSIMSDGWRDSVVQKDIINFLPKNELEEELRRINQRLIHTFLHIVEDEVDAAAAEGGRGIIVKCSFNNVALSPTMKSHFASTLRLRIQPLRLLVPNNYPICSPVVLDKFDVEFSNEYEDLLTSKAYSRFTISLESLDQPMSLGEIARVWDKSVREVVCEYAQQRGGGTFSSKYGKWENYV